MAPTIVELSDSNPSSPSASLTPVTGASVQNESSAQREQLQNESSVQRDQLQNESSVQRDQLQPSSAQREQLQPSRTPNRCSSRRIQTQPQCYSEIDDQGVTASQWRSNSVAKLAAILV